MALNMARINEPLKGVVSFHGNLMTGVKPTTNKIPVLVLNGEDDTFVSKDEITSFKNRWILPELSMSLLTILAQYILLPIPMLRQLGKI